VSGGENDAFKDIPGTVLFDATQSRLGYALNQFCMSLMKADARAAFKADEAGYLQRFAMSDAQRGAVLARDYNRMIALGGNIYFLAKLGATDGFSFQNLAAKMTGVTEEAYLAMMVAGGRSPEGNRSVAERRAGAGRAVGELGSGREDEDEHDDEDAHDDANEYARDDANEHARDDANENAHDGANENARDDAKQRAT
jgi:protocatechuate 4,5-dioxygenase alpha chain